MCVKSFFRAGRETGVTLIELIISIVVLGLALSSILLVMTSITQHSADPMLRQQAVLIAESYLEEILMKPFLDPSLPAATTVCPTKETSRAAYDNICDYHGLADNNGAVDQLGSAVSGLSAYNIMVNVVGTVGDGTALNTINNIGALRVLRIDVEVTHDEQPDQIVRLSGYRVNYRCNVNTDSGCKPRT